MAGANAVTVGAKPYRFTIVLRETPLDIVLYCTILYHNSPTYTSRLGHLTLSELPVLDILQMLMRWKQQVYFSEFSFLSVSSDSIKVCYVFPKITSLNLSILPARYMPFIILGCLYATAGDGTMFCSVGLLGC